MRWHGCCVWFQVEDTPAAVSQDPVETTLPVAFVAEQPKYEEPVKQEEEEEPAVEPEPEPEQEQPPQQRMFALTSHVHTIILQFILVSESVDPLRYLCFEIVL